MQWDINSLLSYCSTIMKGLIAYIHTEQEKARENKNERADYNMQIIYLIYNNYILYMYIKLNIFQGFPIRELVISLTCKKIKTC